MLLLAVGCSCLMGAAAAATAPPAVVATVGPVRWGATPLRVASTAATVEVDVMPFLARVREGGPFTAYYRALSELGADFVRYAPWCPYPRVVVPELTPSDCTTTKPATNWNSTLFDGIMKDFMTAVCGPEAASGACQHSVAQQLSTMPAWLYKGGFPASRLDEDPWAYCGGLGDNCKLSQRTGSNYKFYEQGSVLVDESCGQMARHMARIVGWYTAAGFHDECGHWHASGLRYNWTILSVLNENEHDTGEVRYTRCFDAIRSEVSKVNPTIQYAGPEGTDYTDFLLDPANHKEPGSGLRRAPDILSLHHSLKGSDSDGSGKGYEQYFAGLDAYTTTSPQSDNLTLTQLNVKRDKLAPHAQFMVNEYIPKVPDWCDADDAASLFAHHDDLPRDELGGGCPGWTDPRANALRMNRKTLGWSAAAAVFADGFGQLALLGYKLVGADQLVGGPWPDNEPAVSCIDWKSGDFNAKYYAIQMLAKSLGSGPKSFFASNITVAGTTPSPPPHVIPNGSVANGTCGHTDWETDCDKSPRGAFNITKEGITDLAGCVARVRQCSHVAFASFSADAAHMDCSWYRSCPSWPKLEDADLYQTQTLQPVLPPLPPTGASMMPVTVYPYLLHATQQRGMLIVCRVHNGCSLTLALEGLGELGAGSGLTNVSALVLEGVGPEPGFKKPTRRAIAADGVLSLGPFGIALVLGRTAYQPDFHQFAAIKTDDGAQIGKRVVLWNEFTLATCNLSRFPLGSFGITANANNVQNGASITMLGQGTAAGLRRRGPFMDHWPRIETGHSDGTETLFGGIPQRGNLSAAMAPIERAIAQLPDSFDGALIFDMEDWGPSWQFAAQKYKNASIQWVLERRPHLSTDMAHQQAAREWTVTVRKWMLAPLLAAKKARPRARVGYYNYPQCANEMHCYQLPLGTNATAVNDGMAWLFAASTALFPTIYFEFVRHTGPSPIVHEAERLAMGSPVLPVWWYYGCEKFRQLCNQSNVASQWKQAAGAGASGVVVWGESVNTTTMHQLQPGDVGCHQFAQYVTTVIGPTAKSFVAKQL